MPLRLIALLCGLAGVMAPVLRGQVAGPPPLVWFAPAPASVDLRDLFLDGTKNPAVDWQDVREQVQVFKFYTGQLLDSHDSSWPNTFAALRDVRAFRKLVDWRLEIAIEVASVKDYSCDTAAGVAGLARALVDRIEREDAWVNWLALDEPFLSGAYECHQPEARTAALVAEFVRTVAPDRPKIKVGLIEAYPTFRVDQIARFFRLVEEHGSSLAFLHLDVDMQAVRALQARDAIDVTADLRTLDAFARARGIPFGYIIWGHAGESDRAYYEAAMNDGVLTLRDTFGAWSRQPAHVIFQSWTRDPAGRALVPPNLPQSTPYTHTYLIRRGLGCLQAIGPCSL
jgi:hypothetical protein